MKIFFKPLFRKFVKKQTRAFQLAIEDEIEKIADNPEAGISKKGDLAEFQIYKFTFNKQVILIAYRISETCMFFYSAGHHENFYRDLKRYLREVE